MRRAVRCAVSLLSLCMACSDDAEPSDAAALPAAPDGGVQGELPPRDGGPTNTPNPASHGDAAVAPADATTTTDTGTPPAPGLQERWPAKVAFMCETGVDDFVRGPCTASYQRASGPAFLADHTDADHTGTPTPLGASSPAGIEYVRLYTAWWRCFLADDAKACAIFEGGAQAPVCTGSTWATCSGKNP